MTDIATVSDEELQQMREIYADLVAEGRVLDPASELDRMHARGIIPAMAELIDEVLRQRKWAREMVGMAASGGRLDGYRDLADKLAAKDAELDRLRAHIETEPEREWAAIDAAIREYLNDYELIGEDDAGADASYTPTQRERVLIYDAINGLLADERVMSLLATRRAPFDLISHIERAKAFSERTFGPGARTAGVIAHIRKELAEIEAAPADLSEWIDVVILALDGAWRAGYSAEQIVAALEAKQSKNEARKWPDWRTAPADGPIEHVRDEAPGTEGWR